MPIWKRSLFPLIEDICDFIEKNKTTQCITEYSPKILALNAEESSISTYIESNTISN